ncbi:MAG: hypothetical protein N2037_02200 [Acidimicrobiales bacterium]|nr:hypothetical protein [Acidimicrobiales bacterium]
MSDTPQGHGWWQASDGKWYPPEQHPDYTGNQAAPASPGVDQTPTQPMAPIGGAGGPGMPPGAGGPGMPPPASGGGKVGLIIGIVVLVLVLAGLGVFLVLRSGDTKKVAGEPTTSTTAGTTTTSSEGTTTSEDDGPTTTRRRPTTSSTTTTSASRRSTTTFSTGAGDLTVEQFDAASAGVAPGIPTEERRAIGRKVCADIASEGSVLGYLLGIDSGQYGDARLTKESFSQLAGMAIAVFCPQFLKELEDLANG